MSDATAPVTPDTSGDASADSSADQHEDHPTKRLYVTIAAVLSILTLMEFSTYFIEFGSLAMPMLLILMAIKFALIVGFFMHLKFDTRLYTRLMALGLVGALILYGGAILAVAEIPNGIPG